MYYVRLRQSSGNAHMQTIRLSASLVYPVKHLFRLQIGGRDASPLTRYRYSVTMCTRTRQRRNISVDGVADKVHDGPMN